MASIDFPNSPAVNDTFTAGNSSYRWTGLAWVSNNLAAITWTDISGKPTEFPPADHTHVKADVTDFAHTHLLADITDYVEPDALPTQTGNSGKFLTTNGTEPSWATVTIPPGTTVSDTAPSSPTAGQLWWKSDTGVLYIFYDNFWVEAAVAPAGPTGPTGLTGPAGPTGPSGVVAATAPITYNSGTQTVGIDANALGMRLITSQSFSASTGVNLNNVFTSAYENYKVIITLSASTAMSLLMRMRVGGVDLSTGNKYFSAAYNSLWGDFNSSDANQWQVGYADLASGVGLVMEFYRPMISTVDTAITFNHTGGRSGSYVYAPFVGAAGIRQNGAYDGFTLYPSTGNITGTVRVYGLAN
jgi:hypothetical protein